MTSVPLPARRRHHFEPRCRFAVRPMEPWSCRLEDSTLRSKTPRHLSAARIRLVGGTRTKGDDGSKARQDSWSLHHRPQCCGNGALTSAPSDPGPTRDQAGPSWTTPRMGAKSRCSSISLNEWKRPSKSAVDSFRLGRTNPYPRKTDARSGKPSTSRRVSFGTPVSGAGRQRGVGFDQRERRRGRPMIDQPTNL
jgi:hypothetical protein